VERNNVEFIKVFVENLSQVYKLGVALAEDNTMALAVYEARLDTCNIILDLIYKLEDEKSENLQVHDEG